MSGALAGALRGDDAVRWRAKAAIPLPGAAAAHRPYLRGVPRAQWYRHICVL